MVSKIPVRPSVGSLVIGRGARVCHCQWMILQLMLLHLLRPFYLAQVCETICQWKDLLVRWQSLVASLLVYLLRASLLSQLAAVVWLTSACCICRCFLVFLYLFIFSFYLYYAIWMDSYWTGTLANWLNGQRVTRRWQEHLPLAPTTSETLGSGGQRRQQRTVAFLMDRRLRLNCNRNRHNSLGDGRC